MWRIIGLLAVVIIIGWGVKKFFSLFTRGYPESQCPHCGSYDSEFCDEAGGLVKCEHCHSVYDPRLQNDAQEAT